jgi:hypothetical protein
LNYKNNKRRKYVYLVYLVDNKLLWLYIWNRNINSLLSDAEYIINEDKKLIIKI